MQLLALILDFLLRLLFMKSILFVCTGNTCRSPLAEGLLKKMLTSHHKFAVTSAGLHAMEGMPANPHTLAVLREKGIDFSLFRSQRVTVALVEQATHVFAMTHDHLRGLSTLYPTYQKKFFLLNEGTTQDDVTDPIGGSLAAYQECGQRIQQALENILMLINKNAL